MPTIAGARSRTAPTDDASGWTSAWCRDRTSAPSSSGLPALASWQAATNASSAGPGKTSRTRLPAAGGGQRGGTHDGRGRLGAQLVEEVRAVAPRLRRPRGDGEQDRQLLDPPGQVVQGAQRRRVGPVGVVDGEQQRALLGQPGQQPVDAVQGGERRGRRVLARVEHRAGQAGRAVEQRRPLARSAVRSTGSSSPRTTPNPNPRSSGLARAVSTR